MTVNVPKKTPASLPDKWDTGPSVTGPIPTTRLIQRRKASND
jgi:hypothetical protein